MSFEKYLEAFKHILPIYKKFIACVKEQIDNIKYILVLIIHYILIKEWKG